MILTGFPDLLSFNRQSRTTTTIKSRLATVSTEAVTGLREDITKAVGGDVGGAHLLTKALNDLEQNQRLNNLSATRVQLIAQSVSGAHIAMDEIGTRATLALNSGNTDWASTISTEAEYILKNVISALSGKHGNRNLLSGDATNIAPYAGSEALLADIRAVIATAGTPADISAALDTYFDDPTGGFSTNQYRGSDKSPPALHLGNGDIINVELRGDDPAIRQVLRGLAVMASVQSSGYPETSAEFIALYQSGINDVSNGTNALIGIEADLGIFSHSIEKANARDNFERAALTETYQNVFGRDQFEAAAELQQLQVQLESAYVITGRMADLTLTNYLR